jgi:hypothetical protein
VRRLYYRQLNGVIMVHDLSDRASHAALGRWAAEVAAEGSFVAPWPDDQAARNCGGLPVPVLLLANKADLGKEGAAGGGGASPMGGGGGGAGGAASRSLRERSWSGKVGWAPAARHPLLGWARGGAGGAQQRRRSCGRDPPAPPPCAHHAADMPLVHGARNSARLGDVDMPALLGFFGTLLACRWAGAAVGGGGFRPGGTRRLTRSALRRRYQPHSGQGWDVPRGPGLAPRQDGDDYRGDDDCRGGGGSQRLDDDWA